MDIYTLAFYGSPIFLAIACVIIAALVWANQGLRAVIAEQEATSANMYEAGALHGYREATQQYKASRPWQDGYEQGKCDGYTQARDELIAIAADTDAARQMEMKR